jgi:hypothetical protein
MLRGDSPAEHSRVPVSFRLSSANLPTMAACASWWWTMRRRSASRWSGTCASRATRCGGRRRRRDAGAGRPAAAGRGRAQRAHALGGRPGGLPAAAGRGDDLPVLLLTARDGSPPAPTGWTSAPTTTWSSRSRWRSCGPCCAAPAEPAPPACSPTPTCGWRWPPARCAGGPRARPDPHEFNLRRGVECRRPVAARPAAAARPRGGRIGRRHLRAGGDAAGRPPHRRARRGGHAVRPPRRHLITTWCAIELGCVRLAGSGSPAARTSEMVLVLIVFCLCLPDTRARRPVALGRRAWGLGAHQVVRVPA